METLKQHGLTLNEAKCQINMSQMTFMGHYLSGKGIGPTQEKVKAINQARQPKNAQEVRSFLGSVNFCCRYIPNMATISEPLRRLTQKGAQFKWGSEQAQSFKALKECLQNAETWATLIHMLTHK